MTQLGLTTTPTMQVDFLDTVTLERLQRRGLGRYLPLVSRRFRGQEEAERAVADLIGRVRAEAPCPVELTPATVAPPAVSVHRRPDDLEIVDGFLRLLGVGLLFAETEKERAFLLCGVELLSDLRRRMISPDAPVSTGGLN